MSREPLRLRDDPSVGRALREDLARASGSAGAPYDVAAGLSRFEETLRGGAGAGSGAAAGKTVLGAALAAQLFSVGSAARRPHSLFVDVERARARKLFSLLTVQPITGHCHARPRRRALREHKEKIQRSF